MKSFQLEEYLNRGVENIVKGMMRASLTNPRSSLFLMQYMRAAGRAGEKRMKAEEKGEHIPPFLIASITNRCNLHCKGCYARANQACGSSSKTDSLPADRWEDIFSQAEDMGIEFILLAGGEPLVRRDVLEIAGKKKNILFPVFTNGTMIENTYLELFTESRNLIPVLSIEGDREKTNARRGEGIFEKLNRVMEKLKHRGILYGVSITVTRENLVEVLQDSFLKELEVLGCKAVIYVEYVPADRGTEYLAPREDDREYMAERLDGLRQEQREMLLISFPGDERASGGCLAAGRGFFHINADGGAEACPFSPYSDTSLREVSLRETMHSPLFKRLREDESLTKLHTGGCALFEQEETVKKYLEGK